MKVILPGRIWDHCMSALFALALFIFGLIGAPAFAADHVKIAAFQSTFTNFPIYVAADLKLFQKHNIDPEIIYGTGVQLTNMVVSGAADFGGFAVAHGITLVSQRQDVRLLVLNQTRPPFNLIVRNDLALPNLKAPYPAMIRDLKGLKLGISNPGADTDTTLRYLLRDAGLDPQKDVRLVPIGDPSTQVGAVKNRTVDGTIAFEPIQTEAVLALKIAKPVLDLQGGQGPEIFRDYAYNGIFARQSFLDKNPQAARNVVAAIVEAEEIINDPAQIERVLQVAKNNMSGIDAAALRQFIEQYRGIFTPVANEKAIANVNEFVKAEHLITSAIPYDQVVATAFMPKTFNAPKSK
ncbi:ABC transporter substrate-binding protein [Paraburkholderia caffeinilytica]|uniref:ABC transporter substrate-binding protein n=1 Tax=Paraburkholderia caffeinilytica TaxID=1761016 RepID=UPI0038B6EAE7